VEIARAKAIQSGLADRIDFHCMDADAIDRSFPREFFDGAISNFGALNCSSRLVALSNEIASLLRPDAPLVLVLMGRYVPWEWAWFIARLKWRKAFRRISKQGATWRGIRIHYHSPTKLAREIRSKFRLIRCTALGILLPPSYASGWLESRPRTFAALASIERILSRFTFLAHIADHYVLTFRRLEKRNPCD
jgi:SAM-dependent methyltransferase